LIGFVETDDCQDYEQRERIPLRDPEETAEQASIDGHRGDGETWGSVFFVLRI